MENTAQMLRAKSEALRTSVRTILNELKITNNEITAQMQINEASAVQKNAEIEQLHVDNEGLAVLKADNETFISKVEEIFGA